MVDQAWSALSSKLEERVLEIEEQMLWPDERNAELVEALDVLHSHWETRAASMIRYDLAWPILLDVGPWKTPLEVGLLRRKFLSSPLTAGLPPGAP